LDLTWFIALSLFGIGNRRK